MADLTGMYGGDPQNLQRVLAQLKELEEVKTELDAKERALGESERGTTTAILDNTGALQKAIQATRELATETGVLTSGLTHETEALRANSEAWTQQIALMREAANMASRTPTNRTSSTAPRNVSRAVTAAEVAETSAVRPVVEERPARRAEAFTYPPNTAMQAMGARLQRVQEAERQVSTPPPLMLNRGASDTPSAAEYERTTAAMKEQQSAAERLSANYEQATSRATRLAMAQREIETTTNQEMAAFAGLDSRLSRNGALTTEFIQALARGNVTMQEFGSQMTSTIGKFGGWAIAGAAVYGVADALKQVAEGATQTQEGIQNLSRFIPGVTSGSGRQQAEGTFRDISQQMNLPISEVTSAMTVMARVFHDVADAGNAARAVLLASRLDAIPQAQSEQYLVGIGQSLNYTGRGGGQQLIGVVNSLNALQNQYGARVNQTLPGVARAAPAAAAGGLSASMLEALVGTAVRAGVPGAQAGTAILRSVGTFAYRPASEATFRRYGIDAKEGDYGSLINQLVKRITDPAPGKELTGQDLNQLAQALGGPLLGSRTLLPLLEHANLIPGMERAAADAPKDSAQQELDKVLGGVGEQARRLGIELQSIGSKLESAGILTPVEILLKALGDLGHAVEIALTPLQVVGSVLSELPGPMKDLLGVLAGAAALRAAGRTNFGFATQQAISRLPGLGGLQNDERSSVVGARARLQESILPVREREAETARQRSAFYGDTVQQYQSRADTANQRSMLYPSDENTAAAEKAEEELANVQARQAGLVAQANAAQERYLQVQEQIGVLKSDELTYEQRYAYLQQQNMVLMEGIQSTLKEELDARVRSAVVGAGGGGAAVIFGNSEGRRASTALQNASAEEQAAIVGATAIAENPQIMDQTVDSGTLAETEAEGGAASAAGRLGGGLAAFGGRAMGSTVATAESVADRVRNSSLDDALGSAALPLALGGGFIGGGIGNALSTAGIGAFAAGAFGKSAGSALGGALDRAGGKLGLGGEEGLGLSERLGEAGESPLLGAGLALGVSGAASGGVAGALEGAAGGAALGFSVGGPLGAGIGAAAGAGLSLVGDLLGAGKKNSSDLTANGRRLQAEVNYGGNPNLASQVPFSTTFGDELTTAFDNTNQTQADAAQTQVQSSVRSLAQVLKDSGFGTKQTYTDRNLLAQAIGGAVSSVGFGKDQGDIGQIIDTANQAIQTRSQGYLTYGLAQTTTGAGAEQAYTRSAAQITGAEATERAAVRKQGIEQDVKADEEAVTRETSRLRNASGSVTTVVKTPLGNRLATTSTANAAKAALSLAKSSLAEDRTRLSSASAFLEGLKQSDLEAIEANAAAVLQQVQQNVSDATDLAQSTTANKMTQGTDALSGARQALSAVKNQKGLAPEARKQDTEQAKAAINTQLQQNAETAAQELQARLSVATASVPDYEPVQQAEVALQSAKTYYNKLEDFAKKGLIDPAEAEQALAAQKSAVIALNDAKYQYSTQIASDTAAIAAAQNPAYAYGQAQSQIAQGQTDLGLARNPDERLQAQAQILTGRNAAKEALQATAQGTYQVTEAQQGGNSVAQAMTGVAAAYTALAQSLGPDQTLAAQQQLASAQQTLHQALQSRITALGALKASETNNTLQQDTDVLAAAEKALAQAVKGGYGATTITADQTAVHSAVLQKTNDYVSQRIATIQFQQSTLQVSAQGALQELQGLEKLKNLSVSEQQQLAEAAYQIETNQDNTSLFDLSPNGGSNIRLPTIYDVRNNLAKERARLGDRHNTDVGGHVNSAGKATIGNAEVNTTGGALETHDTTAHTLLTNIAALLRAGGVGNSTTIVHSGHSGDALARTSRRIKAHARSAGLSGS